MTLFGLDDTDYVVFDAKGPADGAANWWAAKCRWCGVFITKFDFTRDDALSLAINSRHADSCEKRP